MHPLAARALAALQQAERAKAAHIARLDPVLQAEELAEAHAADPRRMLVQMAVGEWADFLREHVPDKGRAKEIHAALVKGLAGAKSAPVVYVQCVDVLAVYEACQPKPLPVVEE